MKNFIIIFTVLCGSLGAEIVEIAYFEEILNHITDDSIILCDIDDTILIPEQMVGSDEWFCALYQKHKEEGLTSEVAFKISLAKWEMVRHVTSMSLVQPTTAFVIQDIQDRGVLVMGLTTQSLTLMERTPGHLEEEGVSFEKTTPFEDHIYFTQVKKGKTSGVIHYKGILFTSGTHKGESFFTLCEKGGYTPKRIIFINDKETHLKEIEESAEKRGIEFVGLRYGYSDAIKANFKMEVAEAQFEGIPHRNILSNEEALKMIDLVK
ncbi:MAG: DUF2608 domain-containing protein [Verrucomicrobia bacterium]|nr:DUF2608 domain-containing protein [Verrucomicrobiota bacterium]